MIGDPTSALTRAADPRGWAHPPDIVESLYRVIHSRRDIRRFRPDDIDEPTLRRVLEAAHAAPNVGHSQPWRFILVREPATRERAAWLADRERLTQAAQLEPEAAAHLLDLQLEGIREAPLGIVVCCDRRTPAAGVLGRATFPDADLWSCACAIENLWLAARAEGLGVGWVTFFEPHDLGGLVGLPDDVIPLGWLCIGWPDERPPEPGLERAAWSRRLPLDDVVLNERWPSDTVTHAPVSKLRAPEPAAVVQVRDDVDTILSAPGSLGVLDRVVDRVGSLGHADLKAGTLLLAIGHHPVTTLGVSAYAAGVTNDVADAARAGRSLGAVAASTAGLRLVVVDGGSATGNLRDTDALDAATLDELLLRGRQLGRDASAGGLLALGEIGIGNTTVAAALAAKLLGLEPDAVVGRGAGADAAVVDRKRAVVAAALARIESLPSDGVEPFSLAALRQLGGPDLALLVGATLGAAEGGAVVVLDGLATAVAALVAVLLEPAVSTHLVAGQRSREPAHPYVLSALGLEPLLDLRVRSGEGVGACLASSLIFQVLAIRREAARTR